MQKKSNPISMIVMMAVIGIIISFLGTDFEIGSYFEGLDVSNVEVLLEYLNLGLGFLALAGVFIFWIWRATRDDKEFYWEFDKEQEQEDEKK
ncbi:MAG: hypothetical protein DRI65_04370 [Chloroflexota bacterium]|nr:MAG: hypothetical protein DRI65_04370 [Chloroflexota bacterium]HDD55643.1 hypothetical protein [Chloroflexota bacterium]